MVDVIKMTLSQRFAVGFMKAIRSLSNWGLRFFNLTAVTVQKKN
jgi:hypothetical protein